MRYWAYLIAKLTVAGAILLLLRKAVVLLFKSADIYQYVGETPYSRPTPPHNPLGYGFSMLALSLLAAGTVWVILWDSRTRCRTCLRRLRMPVGRGSWSHILLGGRPKTEYICPYGHGTLRVDNLQLDGGENPDWRPHEDIWTELRALEESKK